MMSNPGVNNEERFQEYNPIKAKSTGTIALSTPPLLIAAESVEGAQVGAAGSRYSVRGIAA